MSVDAPTLTERLLGPREAARLLGWTTLAVLRCIERHSLPVVVVGTEVGIPPGWVATCLANTVHGLCEAVHRRAGARTTYQCDFRMHLPGRTLTPNEVALYLEEVEAGRPPTVPPPPPPPPPPPRRKRRSSAEVAEERRLDRLAREAVARFKDTYLSDERVALRLGVSVGDILRLKRIGALPLVETSDGEYATAAWVAEATMTALVADLGHRYLVWAVFHPQEYGL